MAAADLADPVVLSSIVQTIVITLTLVVFILSFRGQNLTIREAAYQKVLDDYGDAIRMMSDKPELYAFQVELFNRSGRALGAKMEKFTREDMVIRNFVVMMYGFFERVHSLYRRKWIDEDTWRQWAAFLAVVCAHPVFKEVHESSREMWDRPFVDYVDTILKQKN